MDLLHGCKKRDTDAHWTRSRRGNLTHVAVDSFDFHSVFLLGAVAHVAECTCHCIHRPFNGGSASLRLRVYSESD
jgi:hypothetical protein